MSSPFNFPVKRMLIVSLVVLLGCRDSDKNSSLIFKELNESLERSSKAIEYSTTVAVEELKSKTIMPETSEKATFWLAKANLVINVSSAMVDSIEKLNKDILNHHNDVVNKKFSMLYRTLNKYENSILNFDNDIKREFESQVQFFGKKEPMFSNFAEAQLLLIKLKNDVKNAENMIIMFCKNQIGVIDGPGFFRKFQVITAVNATKLGVGDELIIQAGVGEFTTASKPDVLINGIKVLPNLNGVAEYKVRVGNTIGRQKVKVKINYTAPDGIRDSLNKVIEYTVVE